MILNRAKCAVLILAGGQSSRMKYPKPWLRTKADSTFLLEIIKSYIAIGMNDITVVLNNAFVGAKWLEEYLEISKLSKVVLNRDTDLGRLHSIKMGLLTNQNKSVFIHNVDSPFVKSTTLLKLYKNRNLNGTSIPSFKGKGGHPILISNEVVKAILLHENNDSTLRELISGFPRKQIEVEDSAVLININTPQDLDECNRIYESVG